MIAAGFECAFEADEITHVDDAVVGGHAGGVAAEVDGDFAA